MTWLTHSHGATLTHKALPSSTVVLEGLIQQGLKCVCTSPLATRPTWTLLCFDVSVWSGLHPGWDAVLRGCLGLKSQHGLWSPLTSWPRWSSLLPALPTWCSQSL